MIGTWTGLCISSFESHWTIFDQAAVGALCHLAPSIAPSRESLWIQDFARRSRFFSLPPPSPPFQNNRIICNCTQQNATNSKKQRWKIRGWYDVKIVRVVWIAGKATKMKEKEKTLALLCFSIVDSSFDFLFKEISRRFYVTRAIILHWFPCSRVSYRASNFDTKAKEQKNVTEGNTSSLSRRCVPRSGQNPKRGGSESISSLSNENSRN